MDKAQQIIDKENKLIEGNFKLNPYMFKIGQLVTVNELNVLKILKFSKQGNKVLVNLSVLYSIYGRKQNKGIIVRMDISELKPLSVLLNPIEIQIEELKKLLEFVHENRRDPNFCYFLDQQGNVIN